MRRDGRERGPAARALAAALAAALRVFFWCSVAAEVGWLVLATLAHGPVSSAIGNRGMGLAHLLALGALALSSGLLVLYERRINTFNEPERQWTLAETLYAVVLFCSLFFGIYAFFGWYYAP